MKKNTQYKIIVNHSLSMNEMLVQASYTNQVETSIHSFPKKETGIEELVAEIICFERHMHLKTVVDEMDSRGLRPGTIEELLAFRAQHKQHELQVGNYNFAIMAIGCEADCSGNGRMCIPWHHEWVGDGYVGAELKTYWPMGPIPGFYADVYFLAIRK